MTRVAILQSAYIPWRGYFDLIASVDHFILYDDVQYTDRDWRNRNQIKTPTGKRWLTIPVRLAGRRRRLICETEIADPSWGAAHWAAIAGNYAKAPCFDEIKPLIKPLYESRETNLSRINYSFLKCICAYLGIKTKISWSWDFSSTEGKTQRLVDLCKATNALTYISGPAAQAYLEIDLFNNAGIAIEWYSYDKLLPYPQINGNFDAAVSIIDLLFNCGPNSLNFLPSLSEKK